MFCRYGKQHFFLCHTPRVPCLMLFPRVFLAWKTYFKKQDTEKLVWCAVGWNIGTHLSESIKTTPLHQKDQIQNLFNAKVSVYLQSLLGLQWPMTTSILVNMAKFNNAQVLERWQVLWLLTKKICGDRKCCTFCFVFRPETKPRGKTTHPMCYNAKLSNRLQNLHYVWLSISPLLGIREIIISIAPGQPSRSVLQTKLM